MDTAMNYQTAQAKLSRRAGRKASLFEAGLVRTALGRAFAMLNPAAMIRNPVMFVTEIGAALTTLTLILDVTGQGPALLPVPYTLAVTFVLWLTVLFANFAEALAEARGRAQADSLKLTAPVPWPGNWKAKSWWKSIPTSCVRATWSKWKPGKSFPWTAKWWKARPAWTSRP